MSLTVSNLSNQNMETKAVTTSKVNQKQETGLLPFIIGAGIMFLFSRCKPDSQVNFTAHDEINDLEQQCAELQLQLQDPNIDENTIPEIIDTLLKIKASIVDKKSQSMFFSEDYKTAKESFLKAKAKIKEFAQWHMEKCPKDALRPEDYNASRAAYFVTSNNAAKEWYKANFFQVQG